MTSSIPALSVHNLSKRFRSKDPDAVSGLNFRIEAGESVAFLGPNGAGKSTTIKMLCGILAPSSGDALVAGHRAGTSAANRLLGLVFGTRSQLHLHMTVAQCFDLAAEIYFVTGAEKRARIGTLTTFFHLGELLPRRVRTLSLGQRMRCELVAALVHRPRILLADEPTIGLDVVAKNQLRELVRLWQQEEQTTLLLTSHDLADIESLCDRCILIDKGTKRFDGSLATLKGELASLRRIQVTTARADRPTLLPLPGLKILSGLGTYTHLYELSTLALPMAEGMALLSAHYGDSLQDIAISEVALEEVLQQMYGGGAT